MTSQQQVSETVPCSFREFLGYFLYLGAFGFGGPIALAGYMQKDLVENKEDPEPLVIVIAGVTGLLLKL